MRIMLVSDFYPPAPGGLEAHVRRLGHELHRRGHDLTVVAGGGRPDTPSTVDDGVRVHRIPGGLQHFPGAYRRQGRAFHPPWADPVFRRVLAEIVESIEPDVVHAHGWCEFSAVAAAGSRPVIGTLHDYGLRCPKKNLLRGGEECREGRGLRCLTCQGPEQGTLKRAVLSAALGYTVPRMTGRVTRFLAVSEHVARRHREARGITVQVIPNFLDVPEGAWTPPGHGLLFVGPGDRHKGLPVLLDAVRRMPPDLARLHVVGTAGPPGGVAGVAFAGRLSGEPLWRRYREAAVVVAPPIWPDPCPTVVLEAMAAGRPVLGTRVGGLPDLVIDGVTGTLVPPGDPAALANAAIALLSDPERVALMSHAAYARSRDFATSTVVDRIESVYADAL
jgi:glycosyltransferase involved in cell wall biosynthesis